jgi:hypothetical protein
MRVLSLFIKPHPAGPTGAPALAGAGARVCKRREEKRREKKKRCVAAEKHLPSCWSLAPFDESHCSVLTPARSQPTIIQWSRVVAVAAQDFTGLLAQAEFDLPLPSTPRPSAGLAHLDSDGQQTLGPALSGGVLPIVVPTRH